MYSLRCLVAVREATNIACLSINRSNKLNNPCVFALVPFRATTRMLYKPNGVNFELTCTPVAGSASEVVFYSALDLSEIAAVEIISLLEIETL